MKTIDFLIELTEIPDGVIPSRGSQRGLGPDRFARRNIRALLAQRDGNVCTYCRKPFEAGRPRTIDHVVPFHLLPTWDLSALVLACEPCNSGKGNRVPTPFVPLLALLAFNQVRLNQAPIERSLAVRAVA